MWFYFFALSLLPFTLNAAVQDAISLGIGVQTLVFHDNARNRILITEIFYPAEDGNESKQTTTDIFNRSKEARDAPLLQKGKKYPLIVVSHGQKSDRLSLTWLLNTLASHGYIIASVDHFGSTWSNNNPEEAIRRWTRTNDISALINSMLKDPLFGPHIDDKKIGMIGYSLGALAGTWLAGGISTKYKKPVLAEKNMIELEEGLTEDMLSILDITEARKSHLDPRIRSFILLAPVYGSAFDTAGLLGIKAPVLIIAGEKDTVAPPESNARVFNEGIPASSLIMLKKAGHTIFTNNANGEVMTLEEHQATQKTIVKEVLKFFDQTL